MKTYSATATPNHSQTEEICFCHVSSKNITDAKKEFKANFRNVGKVSLLK